MIAQYVELLSQEWVEMVHETSLEILEEVGLLVRNAEARKRFAKHGCKVDHETQLVKFPREVIDQFIQVFPSQFTFHGRDPEFDVTIPDDGPLFTTGSSVPDMVDLDTGEVRRATSDDIAQIAHLVNELPGYDVISIPVIADDAPPGHYHLYRYYPALKNTLKPVLGSAPNLKEAMDILRLGIMVAGNEDNYRARPFLTYGVCPVISPLLMDHDSTEMLMFYAEQKLPCSIILAPNSGMTAPMTLLGTLALCNAEFLATAVLAQMSSLGTPLIYSALPTVADMRTGAYVPGGIETAILMMGCAQMARFYNVPCAGFIGLTNAKLNDAQSGYETGLSTMAALNAGLDLFYTGGLLDGLSTFDYAKLVIDSEITSMLKFMVRGYEDSSEGFALDVIEQVGPGGTYINLAHTRKNMRKTAFFPDISDRESRSRWDEFGALDTHQRAIQKAREILAQDNPSVLSPDIDARIRAEYEVLNSAG